MRYYFDLYNDVIALDREGTELPDVEAAREFAIQAIRELICEDVQEGKLSLKHRIDVRDEEGRNVLTVAYRDAFQLQD